MEESRAAAAHETDALLEATGGIPDPADLQGLADEAVEQVRAWLEDARGHEADFAAQQLAAARTWTAGP